MRSELHKHLVIIRRRPTPRRQQQIAAQRTVTASFTTCISSGDRTAIELGKIKCFPWALYVQNGPKPKRPTTFWHVQNGPTQVRKGPELWLKRPKPKRPTVVRSLLGAVACSLYEWCALSAISWLTILKFVKIYEMNKNFKIRKKIRFCTSLITRIAKIRKNLSVKTILKCVKF